MKYLILFIPLVTIFTVNAQNTFPPSGNVGVGTTSPGYELHLYGSGEQAISITSTDTTSALYFRKHNAARDGMIAYHEDGRLGFHLDTNSGGGLRDNEFMTLLNTGSLGLGTTSPSGRLEVNGSISTTKSSVTKIQLTQDNWSGTHALLFNAYKNVTVDGNLAAHGNTAYANDQGSYGGGAASIMFMGNGGRMDFFISPASTGKDQAIDWGLPKMRILRNGNVGIGTGDASHKLEVNGTIRSKEVKVEAAPWPDYVFSKDYDLRSLEEIESFINSNGHLPEIPTATQIEAEGLKLGEMNRLLLQKIEELTLYTIEQEQEIERSKQENSKLRRDLKATRSELLSFGKEIQEIKNLISSSNGGN